MTSVFGRPFVKRFILCYQTVVCPVLSVCDVGVLWPNGWTDQDETWHAGCMHASTTLCTLNGVSAPLPQTGIASQVSPHVRCGQTDGWIKMPLRMEVGLGRGDFVLDGDPPSSSPKKQKPKFSAHVYCGQTAAWIKMSLGMEQGLRPGDFVLDGDPVALSPKGGRTPQIFGPCLL